MKILIPTLEYPPQIGGIGSYIFSAVKHWPNQEDELIICAPHQKEDFVFDKENNWKVYRKKLMYQVLRPRWLKLFFILLKIVKKENIDKLFIHHVLPVGYMAYLINKIKGVKYDIFLHGFDFGLAIKDYSKRRKFVKICSKADKIIVNSNFLKDKVANEFPEYSEKITVVYPCPSLEGIKIDHEKLKEMSEKYNMDGRPMILTCSRIVERKGHDMIIKSLVEVVKKIPNILYLICGQGEYKPKLIDLVKEKGLDDNVKFINFVSKDDLPYLYSMANIFVMPSRQLNDLDVEGFGIVFLEANLFGTPVIGGNSGGIPEAIEDEKSGLLVDSQDINDISEKVIKLLKNKDLANSIGEYGKKRVVSEFNWSKQLKKIV